ncbi:MAG: hypothetical protein CO156_05270 [Candidatus Pacebacteria bacterium CG_4_9_14_3_um_filter_40_12]|nr:MAG: hypothetical protein COY01_04045 [Candidatus Pacebacteria bacterium CG_4_10_14_0_2_um_filter_40_20]PJA68377.1 MAG: hypothetical protein CO156_05270 [Candidatus Pacebacteria bacterium CG_4_9_14_3_um_filter_40_12]PJC41239.1 MAG: hypothetical protein CO041_05340 [Candidatus Pacebacteria bacterium CG_4_9_14_0_2_um_filter_40_15]
MVSRKYSMAKQAKKRVLLTGDDGYNSLGTRLVIAALRDAFDLHIAGTLRQQSAVGSKISIHSGFEWGKDTVDDVPALWVDATPADAIELATAYFDEPFDFVVSGVNWGANLGAAIPSSGTLGAAQRTLAVELAPKAIAYSWDLPVEMYTMAHNGVDSLDEYMDYPGNLILPILQKAIKANWWDASLLNVNFPAKKSLEAKLTQLLPNLKQIYTYDSSEVTKNPEGGHFNYTGNRNMEAVFDVSTDVGAVNSGYISITPCKYDYQDIEAFEKNKQVSFQLR